MRARALLSRVHSHVPLNIGMWYSASETSEKNARSIQRVVSFIGIAERDADPATCYLAGVPACSVTT
jgi:hypothetical protein